MGVITDSARLYGLFERLYEKAVLAGYAPPKGYSTPQIVTGLKEAVAFNHPSSQHPEDLHVRIESGHIVLERLIEDSWKELARVVIQ
ncbi:hypothetical protein HYX05_00475 [Candidatus Woesearchaeota archaeon]|nr:hypothetical protein [Candidatus Woesearchaeota archaeon]